MVNCMKWDAWYDRQPDVEDDRLHVAGEVECESSGIQLSLEPDNQGINPHTDRFRMVLVASVPPAGDTQVVVRRVEWAGPLEDEKKFVEISGACSATIDVHIVQ